MCNFFILPPMPIIPQIFISTCIRGVGVGETSTIANDADWTGGETGVVVVSIVAMGTLGPPPSPGLLPLPSVRSAVGEALHDDEGLELDVAVAAVLSTLLLREADELLTLHCCCSGDTRTVYDLNHIDVEKTPK